MGDIIDTENNLRILDNPGLFGPSLRDGSGGPFYRESVTSCFPVITTDHAFIHERLAYTQSEVLSIADAKTGTVRITTPSTTTATAAALTSDMTNALADVTLTAVTPGANGNDISVTYVDPAGNNQELAVSVTGQAITVSLATGPGGAITSTAAQVKAAINAHAAASALVTAEDEGVGSGIVNAKAVENLSGGTNAVYVHFKPAAIQSTASVTVRLYEAATVTGTETLRTPRNRNRLADDDSSVLVRTCPDATLGSTTVQLDAAIVPGGGVGATRIGGSVAQAEEWVLAGNTSYVLAISNASGGAASVAYSLFWYEESGA